MEKSDPKIDELIGVVKDLATKVDKNTSVIGQLSVQTKENTADIRGLATSIDDLAVMVKDGFDAVDHRFNNVEKDIGILKTDVSDIKLTIDDHPRRYEFDALGRRVEGLELKAKAAD